MQKNEFEKNPQSCEKASICNRAKVACTKAISVATICDPKRRWMYCDAWKKKLGMRFDKDLGVYILSECPHCGANLKKTLMRRANP